MTTSAPVELYCLPIEVKVRDLDTRLRLALRLVDCGASVLIGRKDVVHRLMLSSGVRFVYLTKGALRSTAEFFRDIRSNGGHVCYLDEEGGFYGNWNTFADRNDPEILKHVDAYFAWGTRQQDLLRGSEYGIASDLVHVTGHPRFDLRKPEFEHSCPRPS